MKWHNAGVATVSFALLHDLLKIDDGDTIIAVRMDADDWFNSQMRVYVRGPSCPKIPEGGEIPRITIDSEGLIS